jgi:hypothetical protein
VKRCIVVVVSGIILCGAVYTQTKVSFELIDGADAKYLEKKVNGLEFGTMLWFDKAVSCSWITAASVSY